ncbi:MULTISPECIES: hypothetical protein [unclassified Cryobacterium]|uniref:hypothetical protein n=1 Tax=unclassified Cryobacterium TaxID=2649013 RepID=UPI000CE2BB23|nr:MULTISPECIES: hypothetical protein [unclassified Cryobacterium]
MHRLRGSGRTYTGHNDDSLTAGVTGGSSFVYSIGVIDYCSSQADAVANAQVVAANFDSYLNTDLIGGD